MVFIPSEFIPEYRPSRKYSLSSSNGWWLNRWPILGWLETFVKVAAWCFVPYIQNKTISTNSAPEFTKTFAVETAIMLLASVLLAAAVIDRLVYREIISMIFVFPNNWAHWTIALNMLRYGRLGTNIKYFRIFCWLMLAGDVIKLIFFAVYDFTRLNIARYVIYLLVAVFALMYTLILLFEYGYLQSFSLLIYKVCSLDPIFATQRR